MSDGEVFDRSWRCRTSVDLTTRAEAEPCIRKHYLGKWPGVNVAIYGMRVDNVLRGVCVFSLPPTQTSVRYGGVCWELSRLWIDDDVPKNAETWLIAQCTRRIRRDHPHVDVLVSYADPSAGHAGTIYKAANWVADGRTDEERKTPRCDYVWQGKKYGRRGHIPAGAIGIERVPRISKWRFIYRMGAST